MREIHPHPAAAMPVVAGPQGDGDRAVVVTIVQPLDGPRAGAGLVDRWQTTCAGVGDDAGGRGASAIPGRRTWVVGRWQRGASWSWCYLP